MSQPIVIVGASTRAAAMSARGAGLVPYCCDMFGDVDLARTAEQFQVVDDYPHGLIAATAEFPPAPWMYVGALENSPNVVAEISKSRPLWGVGPGELARIRNPLTLRAALEAGGVSVPTIRESQEPPPRDRSWVVKPIRSAGGRSIRIWNADATAPQEPHYFQKHVFGEPMSAIWIGAATEAPRLCGVTRQLIGEAAFHARPFTYCGSIGPIKIDVTLNRELARLGKALAQFNLAGLFGVDFAFDGMTAWILEVNPRYSASIEVLERATATPLLAAHAGAFDVSFSERLSRPVDVRVKSDSVHGKAIVFAATDCVCSDLEDLAKRHSIEIADIPALGSVIHATQPICTVFAEGRSEIDVMDSLKKSAEVVLAVSVGP